MAIHIYDRKRLFELIEGERFGLHLQPIEKEPLEDKDSFALIDAFLSMCRIVNRCGDPDTNAAIAGALLGAVYGDCGIPREWQNEVLCCRCERPMRYRAAQGMQLLEELIVQAQ